MKSKSNIIGILTLSVLFVLLFPSVKANINDKNSNINLKQTDTLAPVIYFDLSGINSTHNITHVTVFEANQAENLSTADIYVNNIAQNGSFSFVDYGSTPPPINPTILEAISSGGDNTYSRDVDIDTDFEEDQHNVIKAEGENTLSSSSRSSLLFCNNQECWNPGLIPLARKSASTNRQNPPNLDLVDNSGPIINFNLTKLACCGFVYFTVSDPYSGVESLETSFSDNILIVNATNGGSVTTKVGVNFGDFEVTSICVNDPCEPCEPCETCETPDITDFTPINFSIIVAVPLLLGIVRTIQLRKRKQKQ
ncbi:MAG: hypothetical protein ACXAAM_05970 [Candidatus Heimdallarchaeaceae archaeon]|jgi:hypothetical protein